jgi:SAM-dependent methyltransferase
MQLVGKNEDIIPMNIEKHLTERVEHDRWQIAQRWEQSHWLRQQKRLAVFGKNYAWKILSWFGAVEKYRGDDRNQWWQSKFDHYRFLPAKVNNALEVGCGPYTNMRLIKNVCNPDHLFLSDPLIRTYVNFRMTFVREMYKSAACILDDHALEELPFADSYFDLAVMINVLDHVRDAALCMKQLLRVLRPGGILILGQDLSNDEDLARQPDGMKVGHPITLRVDWFHEYLNVNFEALLRKELSRDEGWEPDWHYATLIYAGRRR